MATDLIDEPTLRAGGRPVLPELAPSDVRGGEPWVARILAAVGLSLVVFGVVLAVRTAYAGNGLVPGWLAVPSAALGIALLLYHAVRDEFLYARRAYLGVAGLCLLGCLATLAIPGTIPTPSGESTRVLAYYFPTWGTVALFVAMAFALTAVRHEDDAFIRQIACSSFLGVGGLLAALGFGGGLLYAPPPTGAARDFFLQPGALMAFLGLLSILAGLSMMDTSTGTGYAVALGVGIVGGLVVIYAIARALIPDSAQSLAGTAGAPKPFLVPYGLLMLALGLAYTLASAAVASDNAVLVIARRELNAFFFQPIAWIVLAGMALFGWFQFLSFFFRLAARPDAPEPVVANYLLDWYPVYAVIIAVPFLTMRLFSEERRSGTLEMLLTAPLNETTLVLGKFLAGLAMFLITALPWGAYLLSMRLEIDKPFDYRPILAFSVVLLATGSAFVAMGMFFSSLTRDQIIAFMLTLVPMILSLSMWLVARFSILPAPLRDLLERASFVQLWIEAMAGRLWVRDIVLWLSGTVFWLFLTVKMLESRKWR
jgi:ABC-type transport system involved in multi-copper enzyme maturation permease subunit